MRKSFCSLVLLVAMVVNLTGCWSRNEVEDLGIVSVIGIDRIKEKGEKKWKFTALVLRPPQLGGTQQSTTETNPEWLVSGVGDTLYDAGRNIGRRSSRALVLYHNEMVIIGEEPAREALPEILDFLQRHKDIRLRNWVLVSRQAPEEIMQALPEMEQTLATEISEMLVTASPRLSETVPVDLNEFTQNLIEPGWDPVVPLVRTVNATETMGSQRGEKEPSEAVTLQGIAVFSRGKLAGYMSPEEAKGVLYVLGKAESGIIPVDYDEENRVSMMMRSVKTAFKPVIRKGKLVMELEIETEADVVEVSGDLPVGEPEVIQALERKFSQEVKRLVSNALTKAQKKFKADIFGFGRHIHIRFPDYWGEIENDWYEIYPELPVSVTVEGKINRTVSISDPFKIR